MKKIITLFMILVMLFSLVACGEQKENKVIINGQEVNIMSTERMHELVKANNDIVSAIYGETMFFNIAEMECHFNEYYTPSAYNTYFKSGIIYESEGNIVCQIKTDSKRENIAHLQYEIMKDSIYFVDNTQTFKVRFYNEYLVYIVQFVAEYDENMQDWLLQDIQL
jgi:hypothetical protein